MSTTPLRMNRASLAALLALAIGSFGIGMTEFVLMGLLPNIAAELHPVAWEADQEASIAQAGWLVSLYALGVVIGAPTIAGAVAKWPRHRVMIALAAALTIFNVATVLAPTFELVGLFRFLAGLPHGAYFGIGALVAADVLGPGKRARGVAIVLTGLTVANVVGVPLGTYLGQNFGWRSAFVVGAVIFAIATVAIALFVPSHPGDRSRTFASQLRVFRIGQVWFAIGIGAVGFGGFFAVYSYIATMVTEVAGTSESIVPWVLVATGVGMTVGNSVGGHLADRNLKRVLLQALAAMILAQAVLAVTAGSIVAIFVLMFLIGAIGSAMSPAIQTRLMDVAGDAQSIAAALNHSALNIGNSLGAFLGGLVIAAGFGFAAPAWVAAALAAAGLAIAILSFRLERSPTPAAVHEPVPFD